MPQICHGLAIRDFAALVLHQGRKRRGDKFGWLSKVLELIVESGVARARNTHSMQQPLLKVLQRYSRISSSYL